MLAKLRPSLRPFVRLGLNAIVVVVAVVGGMVLVLRRAWRNAKWFLLAEDMVPGTPERASRLFVNICAVGMVAFFVWAAIGALEVVSVATGEVIPSTQIKSVQHLEGGIVSEILVRDGDTVKLDQPLVVLEAVSSGADVGELTLHIAGIQADIARLEAEQTGAAEPVYPPALKASHPDLVAQSATMFHSRRERFHTDLRAQQEQITQRVQAVKEIMARIRNSKSSLVLVDEQVHISEEMLKEQLSNRLTHLSLLKQKSDLQSRIDEDNAGLLRLQSAEKEAQSQLESITQGYMGEVHDQLDKARRDWDELTARMGKYSDNLARTVLRSPVDGVVKTVYVTTRGGVVQAGKTVVDIVPADDRLVIEAKLPIYDVGYIRPGQKAWVRLASSDGARFGNLAGAVVNVSPDSIVTEEGAFYRVRIETDSDRFRHEATEYRLVPGIQVQISIITGQRTVLDYLIDPLRGYSSQALRER